LNQFEKKCVRAVQQTSLKHFNYQNVNTVCLACTETFQNIHYPKKKKKNFAWGGIKTKWIENSKICTSLLTKEEIDVS